MGNKAESILPILYFFLTFKSRDAHLTILQLKILCEKVFERNFAYFFLSKIVIVFFLKHYLQIDLVACIGRMQQENIAGPQSAVSSFH